MKIRNLAIANTLFVALLAGNAGFAQEERKTNSSANLEHATASAWTAAQEQLRDAAAAHKVNIQYEQMAYVSDQHMTMVQAPISGIGRYRDADFKVGAPIMLIIVKSTNPLIPNGSYVVKAQFQPGDTSGQAIFIGRTGTIVARRDLIVRTREQSAILFPAIYSKTTPSGQGPEPAEIPNITSSHCFYDATNPKHQSCWVDCSGWQPFRTLIFASNQ